MDDEFDDAALWAVIDSAAASYISSNTSPIVTPTTASKYQTLKYTPHLKSTPPKPQLLNRNSSSTSLSKSPSVRVYSADRPAKIPRNSASISEISRESCSPNLLLVKGSSVNRLHSSPQINVSSPVEYRGCDDFSFKETNNNYYSSIGHCLAAPFPTVSLFKDYQDAAMSILEKSDYTVISGNPFIKKSGWRKIAFYFNVSFEIRDKTIEFDENRNVQRAEFVARAYMQGGRFSDGWGSCERREKKFLKPNNDIPSTAETRAKNRACQDLLGIGQYQPGVHSNPPR